MAMLFSSHRPSLLMALAISLILVTPITAHAQTEFAGRPIAYPAESNAVLKQVFSKYTLFEMDASALRSFIDEDPEYRVFSLKPSQAHHWQIELYENELRPDDYMSMETTDRGLIELPRTPCITFAGYVHETAKEVRLNIEMDRIWGYIQTADGYYYIEPLNRFLKDAPPAHYLMYLDRDVIHRDTHACGATPTAKDEVDHQAMHYAKDIGPDCRKLEIATEADFQFVNSGKTSGDILGNLNLVEGMYMNTFSMKFLVVFQHQWSTSSNPYSSSVACAANPSLLNQFTSHWFNNFGNIRRDISILYSEKNFDGSTIGCAWIGTFGNGNNNNGSVFSSGAITGAYSVNQWSYAGFLSTDNGRRTLIAHEMGHNFGAEHDDSNCGFFDSGNVMCPNIKETTFFRAPAQIEINSKLNHVSAEPNDGRSALRIREIPANSQQTTTIIMQPGTVSGNIIFIDASLFWFPTAPTGNRIYQGTEHVTLRPGFVALAETNRDITLRTGTCNLNSSLIMPPDSDEAYIISDTVVERMPEMNAYPNPATSEVNIELNGLPAGIYRLEIFDLYGKRLQDSWVPENQGRILQRADLSQYPTGIYIIRISDPDGTSMHSTKVLKAQ